MTRIVERKIWNLVTEISRVLDILVLAGVSNSVNQEQNIKQRENACTLRHTLTLRDVFYYDNLISGLLWRLGFMVLL